MMMMMMMMMMKKNVFATSLIDRYAARPLAIENICLATFAVTYDVIQSSTQTEETEDVNAEEEIQNTENDVNVGFSFCFYDVIRDFLYSRTNI